MIKVALWMLSLVLVCYGGFCLLLYFKQRSLLYYPVPEVTSGEAEFFYLENGDERLKVWHIPGDSGRAIIYFGGNAEDVSGSIAPFKDIFPNFSIYLLNYRGYGGSSGSPSESALLSDSLLLYDHVRKSCRSVTVIGRSLGTGVGVYLASMRTIEKLVLVTPYDSMARLAASYYPFIPVALLMEDTYESYRWAERIEVPTMVLIAERDEVIPRKRCDSLVSVLNDDITEVSVIKGANHNTIGMFPEYNVLLRTFIANGI